MSPLYWQSCKPLRVMIWTYRVSFMGPWNNWRIHNKLRKQKKSKTLETPLESQLSFSFITFILLPSRHTGIHTESWDCFTFVHSYAFPLWTPPFYVWFFMFVGELIVLRFTEVSHWLNKWPRASLPLANKTIHYQVSILWQKDTISTHTVYDYTVNMCTYYEYTILFSISPLTVLFTLLLFCLFFAIIIVILNCLLAAVTHTFPHLQNW